MNSCSFSAKFHGLDLLCHFRSPAVLFLHRFFIYPTFLLFTYYYKCSNKKLCRVATLVSFFGKYRYHVRRDKNEHHASAVDQLKGFRTFAMRTLLRAAHCLCRIQQQEHFVSLAVRAPLWAAHCRVASDCPSPSLPCNARFFFL